MTKIKTKKKLQNFGNSKCDKTQKLKMWQISKTGNVTIKNSNMAKFKNSKCDKTQKL